MSITINILYFASMREQLKTANESLQSDGLKTVADLKKVLSARGDIWQNLFSQDDSMLVSVNQQMADELTPLADGDEVGFFPPVTGG